MQIYSEFLGAGNLGYHLLKNSPIYITIGQLLNNRCQQVL